MNKKVELSKAYEDIADVFRKSYLKIFGGKNSVTALVAPDHTVSYYILVKGDFYHFEDMVKFNAIDLQNVNWCKQFAEAYPKAYLEKRKKKEWSKRY